MTFAERYGPWAVIAGASEGTGRAFAEEVASRGVHCILLARREAPLAELAQRLQAEHGVQCLYASVDLSAPDAFDRIRDVVGEREVGLFISNAGADPNSSLFLDREVQVWVDLIERNLVTTLRCVHHFATSMRERRRGGLIFVGSGAGWGGARYMATYAGTKAFDLCFSESLWAELRPFDVDVLHVALVITDTPALRKLLSDNRKPLPSRMASPAKIAAVALNRLRHGPHYNWGQLLGLRAGWRRVRVHLVGALSKNILGEH
jgi:short-subunit dehydrogenase